MTTIVTKQQKQQPARSTIPAAPRDSQVLGTVSQYVLRNAPCPVLTVPEVDIDSRGKTDSAATSAGRMSVT
jgi:hypothetical protein